MHLSDSHLSKLLTLAYSDAVEEMAADDGLVLVCEDVIHEHGLRRDVLARDARELAAAIRGGQ